MCNYTDLVKIRYNNSISLYINRYTNLVVYISIDNNTIKITR